jgi:exosortase
MEIRSRIPSFTLSHWVMPCILTMLAFFAANDAIINMLALWTTDTYMHGAFVVPLAAIMAKQMPSPSSGAKPLHLFGIAVLVTLWIAGMLLGALAMINVIQQVMVIALIPLAVVVCYGWRFAFHYRAPLMLIFFAVPVGDFLIPYLQSITADLSVFFLQLSGVSVLRNGWYLSIPAADFRVAEACSGVNFLISTFTVAVFYAFTYMESKFKRVGFIALGFVVPILANGLRVYLIIMIAHWGNVEAATGFDHLVYGWIFFVFILIALFTIGYYWQEPAPENNISGVSVDAKPLKLNKTEPFLVLMAPLCVLFFTFSGSSSEKAAVMPSFDGASVEENDTLGPQFPEADLLLRQRVGDNQYRYVVHYQRESAHKKIISFQNRWFNDRIWSLDKLTTENLDGNLFIRNDLVDLSGRKHTLLYSYCIGGDWVSKRVNVKLYQAWSRLVNRDFGGTAYGWFGPSRTFEEFKPDARQLKELCK